MVLDSTVGQIVVCWTNRDHDIVFGKLAISKPKTRCHVGTVRNFNNIDGNQLNYALIQAGWENIFGGFTSDIGVIYENWFELFLPIVDRYIPKKM